MTKIFSNKGFFINKLCGEKFTPHGLFMPLFVFLAFKVYLPPPPIDYQAVTCFDVKIRVFLLKIYTKIVSLLNNTIKNILFNLPIRSGNSKNLLFDLPTNSAKLKSSLFYIPMNGGLTKSLLFYSTISSGIEKSLLFCFPTGGGMVKSIIVGGRFFNLNINYIKQ